MSLTTIQLTPSDAILFVEFQRLYSKTHKHTTFIKLLESLGAFEIKNGSLTVHFGSMGQIGKIDIHTFYSPKPVDNL